LLPFAVGAMLVLAIDLTTKRFATRDPLLFGHGVIYNDEISAGPVRLAICAVTIVVVATISHIASRRGIGEIPLVWLAGGVLVGGVLANWISSLIWDAGVPDFISQGDRLWNLADFSIGLGMLLFLTSSIFYAVRTYARGRR
jgi:lipoprotein signal peptidase